MAAKSDAILERLLQLHPKLIDLSLDRVEVLLDKLGNPQDKLPPVIHVAGTNGKGSTLAYLRAMLEADGRKIHVYTSPHLVRFHERIRLAGELIAEDDLAALLEEVEEVNGGQPITFFEVTTIAAFLAFSRVPADVVLLETGLGGRLDATNMVKKPLITALTPISLDHTQFLGEDIQAIAREKAGIMKEGVPCVIGQQSEEALIILKAHAAALNSPLLIQDHDWKMLRTRDSLGSGGFGLQSPDGATVWPAPVLPGAHQYNNAAQALVIAEQLGDLKPSLGARGAGLVTIQWPARMQRLISGPLVDLLPDGWELWLDGGHNEAAGEALAKHFEGWDDKPLYLVYGMMNTKAAKDFLLPLAKATTSLKAVTIPDEPNSLKAEDSASHAREVGIAAGVAADFTEAVKQLLTEHSEDQTGRILICGSLYLAGHVLMEHV